MKTLITVLTLSIVTATPMLAEAASWQTHSVQAAARGSVAPYVATEGGPYTPDAPAPAHGFSQDFQDGSRG